MERTFFCTYFGLIFLWNCGNGSFQNFQFCSIYSFNCRLGKIDSKWVRFSLYRWCFGIIFSLFPNALSRRDIFGFRRHDGKLFMDILCDSMVCCAVWESKTYRFFLRTVVKCFAVFLGVGCGQFAREFLYRSEWSTFGLLLFPSERV